jgi:hypothetical protein
MTWINGFNTIATIASTISAISVIFSVILYSKRVDERKALKSLLHSSFNSFYGIARITTRIRDIESSSIKDDNKLKQIICQTCCIQGYADSARTSLISYARECLKFNLQYEHPGYPNKFDWPDDVKMGIPPEKKLNSNK